MYPENITCLIKIFKLYYDLFYRNLVILQFPSKEPLKTDTKSSVVPPYISNNAVDNANQSSQTVEKKNAHLNNSVLKQASKRDKEDINEHKIVNDNTFAMQLVNKIENWSPSTAKYARLSIFGCKVNIYNFSYKIQL